MNYKSHILKLAGRAELPEAIEMGHNYHVSLSGSVPKVEDADNEDGTYNRLYTFKPIKVELLDKLGKTIPAKDTRSDSQLLRNLLYKKWVNSAQTIDFDEYRHRFMLGVMRDTDELVEKYIETPMF